REPDQPDLEQRIHPDAAQPGLTRALSTSRPRESGSHNHRFLLLPRLGLQPSYHQHSWLWIPAQRSLRSLGVIGARRDDVGFFGKAAHGHSFEKFQIRKNLLVENAGKTYR